MAAAPCQPFHWLPLRIVPPDGAIVGLPELQTASIPPGAVIGCDSS